MTSVAGLRRFVTRRSTPASASAQLPPGVGPSGSPRTAPQRRIPGESCELCGTSAPQPHPHVVDLDSRRLLCACKPCALLFTAAGSGGGHYRTVPDRYLYDPASTISALRWDALGVPVAVAFFFDNSVQQRVVAHYPSPAGATESLLDLAAWADIRRENPLVAALEPDVEALVVRRPQRDDPRPGGATDPDGECYLVPVDACYELVGSVRRHWSGLDGGAEVRADLEAFFAEVRHRARPLRRAGAHG